MKRQWDTLIVLGDNLKIIFLLTFTPLDLVMLIALTLRMC